MDLLSVCSKTQGGNFWDLNFESGTSVLSSSDFCKNRCHIWNRLSVKSKPQECEDYCKNQLSCVLTPLLLVLVFESSFLLETNVFSTRLPGSATRG